MFLRKLFNSNNKFTWVLIDLLIVIIGVYCAFLIQSYAEQDKTNKEKDKIYTALKYELESFRFLASEIALGISGTVKEWEDKISNDTYHDFSGGRFIAPQFDYQIVEHAINTNDSDIIDFELYDVLQQLHVGIKKAEHTERLLTEIALRYRLIPPTLDSNSKEVKLMSYENFNNFRRYVMFTKDRGSIMQRIIVRSQNALAILNDRIDPAKRKEIERNLMKQKMPEFPVKEVAVGVGKKYFPNWSEEEILEIYDEVHGVKESKADSPQ